MNANDPLLTQHGYIKDLHARCVDALHACQASGLDGCSREVQETELALFDALDAACDRLVRSLAVVDMALEARRAHRELAPRGVIETGECDGEAL